MALGCRTASGQKRIGLAVRHEDYIHSGLDAYYPYHWPASRTLCALALVSFCLLSHSHRVHLTPSLRQFHARPCPRCLSPLYIVIFPTGRKGSTLGGTARRSPPQWLSLQILVWGQYPLFGPLAAGAACRCRSTSADLSAVCAELSRDTRSTFSDTRHLTYLCIPYRWRESAPSIASSFAFSSASINTRAAGAHTRTLGQTTRKQDMVRDHYAQQSPQPRKEQQTHYEENAG
jgi:hypothetical protein